MKVTTAQLAKMQGKFDQFAGILFYGSDAGLIHERASSVVRGVCGSLDDPFRLCLLSREQHARLLEESTAQSLTGGRRVIRVADAGDVLLSPLKRAAAANGAALIVLEAPGLAARSKLKAFAESAPNWATVSCYSVSGPALQAEIKQTFASDRVDVTDDAAQFVTSRMAEDQLLRRADLETLALYAGPGSTLTLEAARDCLRSSQESDIDDALHAALAGHVGAADRSVASLMDGDMSGPGMLASLTYHLVRVLRARRLVEGGLGPDAAMRALAPPVFFQRQAVFAEGLRLWTAADLLLALGRAREADIACKRAASADVVIAARLLTSLAREAELRRGRSGSGSRPTDAVDGLPRRP